MNDSIDRKDEEIYKDEIKANDTKIKEYYNNADELYGNLINEKNPRFKLIINDRIEDMRRDVEILEKRNEELAQLLANQEELNKSLEEIINYIESI